MYKSHATHWAHITCNMCYVVPRDSSAVKFDRVHITFTFALFHCLKPLTDKVGGGVGDEEETRVPRENPQQ